MSVFHQWKLRGPVRTLRTELAEWDITNEQWQAPRSFCLVQLRPDGKVVEQEDHNPNGSISRSRYTYDDTGRLLETTFQLDERPTGGRLNRYDESGRLVRTLITDGDGLERDFEVYSYNEDGRKTKLQFVPRLENPGACGVTYAVEGAQLAYGAEGVATITTLYDDREESCEALFHNHSGSLVLRVVLSRDDAGRLIAEESRSGDEPPFSFARELENAPAEERTEALAVFEQLFSPHKPMWSTTYGYDERGRQITRRTVMAGMQDDRMTLEYDEYDNSIRQIEERTGDELVADESGNLQTANPKSFRHEVRYEYKYDSHGNWTERVVSVRYETNPDFQRSNVERREIIYYTS
jgi:YD repeat-containing protein